MLYCARVQSEVFRRRYFLCGAFFKTKDIVTLRSSFKKRTTRKRARLKLQIVPARSIGFRRFVLWSGYFEKNENEFECISNSRIEDCAHEIP